MATSASTKRHPWFQDISGQTFGKWKVLSYDPVKRKWLCQCACGAHGYHEPRVLKKGETTQCRRCSNTPVPLESRSLISRYHREYMAWRDLNRRCYEEAHRVYGSYGGRGIAVRDHWRDSFPAFLEDMGPKPNPKLTIERIDNDLGYTCGKCEDCAMHGWTANCRWATHAEQSRNRRRNIFLTFDGRRQCMKDWANERGMTLATLRSRLKLLGWTIEEALTTPVGLQGRRPIGWKR